MAILRPDSTSTLGGVTVKEYLLTKHNPNRIDMPSASMAGKIIGVTVHNTDWISVASGTTPAEPFQAYQPCALLRGSSEIVTMIESV